MATSKEKLAASLLNHWFVTQRGTDIGRLKKRPASTKYKLLSTTTEDAEVLELARGFSRWNIKHFLANLQHLADQEEMLKANGISIKIKTPTQNNTEIEFEIQNIFKELVALRKAISFPTQSTEMVAITESIPALAHQYPDSPYSSGTSKVYLQLSTGNTCLSFPAEEERYKSFVLGMKILLSIYNQLSVLSAEHKRDILNNKAYLRIENATISDDKLVATAFNVEETEEARVARRAKERLEEALRRRTQHVTSITTEANKVRYEITANPALQVNLDILTQW